jgi:hypothetical protein
LTAFGKKSIDLFYSIENVDFITKAKCPTKSKAFILGK